MLKWVEDVALVKANDRAVIQFLYGEIFTHFGVPKEIVTYGGPQFVSHKLEALLQKYHIQHMITFPIQSTGQGLGVKYQQSDWIYPHKNN